MRAEREFSATSEGIAEAQAFLDSLCVNPRVSIVVDEIASNIVRCSGSATFHLVFNQDDEAITLEMSDSGKPFDPTAVEAPDVTLPADQREVGGLGIFMVRKMAKSFDYRREDGKNIVTIAMKS